MTTFGDARLPARFWSKVEQPIIPGGCWLWAAALEHGGYGRYWFDGLMRGAHRVAYEALVDAVPPGKHLDHRCRFRSCVNLDHLEPVTQRENTLRGISLPAMYARRTKCSNGHELSGRNVMPRKEGGRRCRKCWSDRAKAQRAAVVA